VWPVRREEDGWEAKERGGDGESALVGRRCREEENWGEREGEAERERGTGESREKEETCGVELGGSEGSLSAASEL
jgi:hypothetical protein